MLSVCVQEKSAPIIMRDMYWSIESVQGFIHSETSATMYFVHNFVLCLRLSG
jgi:hypothetical protein